MTETEIRTTLREYDFSDSEIEQIIQLYNLGVQTGIPFPLYFAISKIKI